ncbi:MgtC/SapB family protein [Spiribacter halobius]|uniref:Uncharacterized protein n=1 Tax=Sediminicurvatus halobius TaxID=2182432 RepID=A0A2U2NA27_9GAMM|nr:MgtC/SapB family protein [Spiribacter halobius]PWG65864.1 hypothetical protein DEM34_00965 [Spiribacter halobius]UEX77911.1 MgtC/SapB family protein [Spiribacter halobius]
MAVEHGSNLTLFGGLAVALAVGLLIGLERGWRLRDAAEGERVAGLRTYGLFGLFGGLAAVLAERLGPAVLAVALAVVALVVVTAHWISSRETAEYGITSLVASLVTFALGALAVAGAPAAAAAGAVVTALMLSLKPELHGWVARLDRRELIAALQLLLISVVILPLLPDAGLGPWGAINPYRLWWLVVLIASISFVGHFAVRIAGAGRGILLTGLFGGMASSTALTVALARERARLGGNTTLLALGIMLGASTAVPRMLLLVAITAPALLPQAGLVLAAPFAAGVVVALAQSWRVRSQRLAGPVQPGRPFQLALVLRFALLLGAVGIAGEAAWRWLGSGGVLAVAALAGLAELNAITLTLGRLAEAALEPALAARALLAALAANTLLKLALVRLAGGPELLRALLPFALAVLLAALAVALYAA